MQGGCKTTRLQVFDYNPARGILMREIIYNTWARSDNHWIRMMLEGWRASGLPFLCFPWINYQLHTLPTGVFWLYMFYSAVRTDIIALQGKIEFRLQVVSWRGSAPYTGQDVHLVDGDEVATAWLMIDRMEELRKEDGSLLKLQDFEHLHGLNILNVMRTGTPNVSLLAPVQVIQHCP
jgi:hypothetical protein